MHSFIFDSEVIRPNFPAMVVIPEATEFSQLEKLDNDNPFYIRLKKMVENSKSRKLEVIEVYCVKNPNIEAKYTKAKQKKMEYYPNFKEELLLHGTAPENLKSICNTSLATRFCVNKQFGTVVYLSESSALASSFPLPIIPNTPRIMFGCWVLIGNSLDIDQTPKERWRDIPSDYDTKVKKFVGHNGILNFENGIVAKWHDDEIKAEFLIVYKVLC